MGLTYRELKALIEQIPEEDLDQEVKVIPDSHRDESDLSIVTFTGSEHNKPELMGDTELLLSIESLTKAYDSDADAYVWVIA